MTVRRTGFEDQKLTYGDTVYWTETVDVDGVTTLTGWTIHLQFTSLADGDTFVKDSASDTDWIGNISGLDFDITVAASPTTIVADEDYKVKCYIENGATRHYLGSAHWRLSTPVGGAFA